MSLKFTPVDDIPNIVSASRREFLSGKTRSIEWRRAQLKQLHRMIVENLDEFALAMEKDLRKNKNNFLLNEVSLVYNEISHALASLDSWAKPRKAKHLPFFLAMENIFTVREPYGSVLIIGPWNYPFQLVMAPLVGAIAGGNCAVVKPSEMAAHTAVVFTKLVPKYLECVRVVNGSVVETTELLAQRHDFVFFTGSTLVGSIVMQAAAKQLTPVLLELGGKSPTIVGADADIRTTARRIVWGRFSNAGQTCIAPDYVLAHPKIEKQLVDELKNALAEFYPKGAAESDDYQKIINERHYARVMNLINKTKGNVVLGGRGDEKRCFIEPTIVLHPSLDEPLMKEEIFGPVLPIISCLGADDAVEFVNERPKPLALYVFSNDSEFAATIRDNTSSGGYVLNDVMMHVAVHQLPFGGVGPSGLGKYHGVSSFEAFTHEKACMERKFFGEALNTLRYAPHTNTKLNLLWKVMVDDPSKSTLPAHLFKVVLLAVVVAVAYAQRLQVAALLVWLADILASL